MIGGQACKQADLWMAALNASALDEASRIRLLEHLGSCEACAARSATIAKVVHAIREHTPELREQRLRQTWARVREAGERPAPRALPSARPWLLGLAAAGTAAIAVASLLWLSSRGTAPQTASRPRLASSAPAAPRGAEAPALRLVGAVEALQINGRGAAGARAVRAGDRLATAARRAVIASGHEVIVVDADTQLSVTGAATFALHSGALAVRTRPGARRHAGALTVTVGDVVVRPLGTTFSVAARDGALRVAVSEGRVAVASPARRQIVNAGQTLRWGGAPAAAAPAELHALARQLRAAEALAAGGTATSERGASAAPRDARAARSRPAAPRHTGRRAPAASGPARRSGRRPAHAEPRADEGVEARLRAVERLLAGGATSAARDAARAELRRPEAARLAPALLTIVAESFVKERRFNAARDAYLALAQRFAHTNPGADALFMAGSLELEQLGQARSAAERFARYLARHPGGRQREGAYYLLCKALLRTGDAARARATVARYRDEFPRGRYLNKLQGSDNKLQGRDE